MIQMRSILDVADNSGARKIAIINPIGAVPLYLAKREPRRRVLSVGFVEVEEGRIASVTEGAAPEGERRAILLPATPPQNERPRIPGQGNPA